MPRQPQQTEITEANGAPVQRGQGSKRQGRLQREVVAGGEGTAHCCIRPRPVGAENAVDVSLNLVADLIACGTRGTRAVGAPSACGERSGGAPRLSARARGRCHGVGGGAAARTTEVQLGEGRVVLERGGQLLGPLGADLIPCGTRGARAVGAARACAARARAVRRKPPSLMCRSAG